MKYLKDYQILMMKDKYYCAHCNNELKELANTQDLTATFDVKIREDGFLKYEKADESYSDDANNMVCPYCKEELGDWSEELAMKILKKEGI